MHGVTPKTLVLDLLRVSGEPVAVRHVIEAGELFELAGNAVRVALARLVARGLVTSDARGLYRLAPQADPISRLVDGWRAGDDRIRPWAGSWLCAMPPRGQERTAAGRGRRALTRLGFRPGLGGLWVRPDNLARARAELSAELAALGLDAGAAVFVGSEFEPALVRRWQRTLWPVRRIVGTCQRALADLDRSARRLPGLRRRDAMVESFVIGGAAIRALALDPLLPDDIADGSARRLLGRSMLRYERLGRGVWSEFMDTLALERAPNNVSMVA